LFCCGREQMRKPTRLQPGVRHVEDPHHPRGYRELRSPAQMRKLLNRKIVEQDRKCAICHQEFTDYNDIVPDHTDPKGMGGAWRDDHPDNIQATHWWCNGEKGSVQRRERVHQDCRLTADEFVSFISDLGPTTSGTDVCQQCAWLARNQWAGETGAFRPLLAVSCRF